jgi:hypothetical protein
MVDITNADDTISKHETLKVPRGAPYLLITFEGPGSAIASVTRGNNVLPAQTLGMGCFILLEAIYNYVIAFKQGQRIITPAPMGRGQ